MFMFRNNIFYNQFLWNSCKDKNDYAELFTEPWFTNEKYSFPYGLRLPLIPDSSEEVRAGSVFDYIFYHARHRQYLTLWISTREFAAKVLDWGYCLINPHVITSLLFENLYSITREVQGPQNIKLWQRVGIPNFIN